MKIVVVMGTVYSGLIVAVCLSSSVQVVTSSIKV